MTIVLDTNNLVSAILQPLSPSAQIIAYAQKRWLQLALSEPLLSELQRVLEYPKLVKLHRWSATQIAAYVTALRAEVLLTPGTTLIEAVERDPDDNQVLACAVEAHADCIVSGDDDLLSLGVFRDIPILTARACLEHLKAAA